MVSPFGAEFMRAASIEILAPEEQARALRTADALAARVGNEIETHLVVPGQILGRGHVRGGVVERRDAVLPAESDELVDLDLPARVGVVEEEHHRRSAADRAFELLPRLHLDHAHAAVAHRMVVAVPVRPLNDDFALHVGRRDVRESSNPLGVLAGDAGRRAQRQGGRRTRGDHHALHAEPLGQPLRDRVVQVVQRHVALGRVLDRLDHLGLHQRGGEDRVRASRVDERSDAELAKVIASGRRGSCAGRRGGEESADEREAGERLQKAASIWHGNIRWRDCTPDGRWRYERACRRPAAASINPSNNSANSPVRQ